MPCYNINSLTVHQAHWLAQLDGETNDSPWSVNAYQQSLRHGQQGLLLRRQRQRIGFLLYQLVMDECHLLKIAVSPDWQRHGMASRLLSHLIYRVCDQARCVLLEVRITNHAALAFYRHHGFHSVGQRPGYYSSPQGEVDAALLQLDLHHIAMHKNKL